MGVSTDLLRTSLAHQARFWSSRHATIIQLSIFRSRHRKSNDGDKYTHITCRPESSGKGSAHWLCYKRCGIGCGMASNWAGGGRSAFKATGQVRWFNPGSKPLEQGRGWDLRAEPRRLDRLWGKSSWQKYPR
jgi:hypothetical protein